MSEHTGWNNFRLTQKEKAMAKSDKQAKAADKFERESAKQEHQAALAEFSSAREEVDNCVNRLLGTKRKDYQEKALTDLLSAVSRYQAADAGVDLSRTALLKLGPDPKTEPETDEA